MPDDDAEIEAAIIANLQNAMKGIAFDLQEALKDKLGPEHGKDTGDLQSSIHAEVTGHLTITITMDEHGKFVEFGSPPHWPPVKDLEGWVARKWGISNDKERARAAWALAAAIAARGTRPHPFIRPTLDQDLPKIVSENVQRAFTSPVKG